MSETIAKLQFNRYDYLIILIVASLAFGKIGGALQIIRLISILLIPFNIYMHLVNKKPVFSGLFYFSVFWLLYAFCSMGRSINADIAKIEIFYLFLSLNIVYSMILFAKRSKSTIHSLILGCFLFMFLTIPIALWEFLTNNHLYTCDRLSSYIDEGRLLNGSVEVFSAVTFENPNEYNTAIVFFLPYIFMGVLMCNTKKQFLIAMGVLLLSILIPIVNASRGALLCIGIDTIFFLYFLNKKYRYSHRNSVYLFLLILFSILFFYSDTIFYQFSLRMEDSALLEDTGRMKMISNAMSMLYFSDFLGKGPLAFQLAYGLSPHNLFMELLTNYGIFVFLFAFVLLGYYLYKFYTITKGSLFRYVPIVVVISFPFCSVINSNYLSYPFFWIAVGSVFVFLVGVQKHNIYRKA